MNPRAPKEWIAFVLVFVAAGACAHEASLGTVDFPVSCSASAQRDFNHAVALLHHMTYPDAREAFRHVAVVDPGCAMAHWGVAMTLFQPLWPTRPGPAELQEGWAAVERARALNARTPRERAFIAATDAFFRDPDSRDYWGRIARWEKAQQAVHEAYPDDAEAAVFYALALLATAPSNVVSRDHADRAAAILLEVYRTHPDHPGVMHYLVHANDMPGREHEEIDITRKYAATAPDNPHALHMPTHIFTRLGDWPAVIRGNLRAAEAALKHPAGEQQQYVWDEFPHAIEYLVYAYLQQGLDDEARVQVRRLSGTARLEPTFKSAFHLASTRARLALEPQTWAEAASIQPRTPAGIEWDRYPWAEAISWFAHGVGAAHTGDLTAARQASDRLGVLCDASHRSGEELFARNIRVLQLALQAWTAHASGDEGQSVQRMREAVELETSTPKAPVTPGPTLPAWEQLGDLLIAQRQTAQALDAYQHSLELYPKRFNSLLGAARAARQLEQPQVAKRYYNELLVSAAPSSRRAAIAEARQFVGRDDDNSNRAGRRAAE